MTQEENIMQELVNKFEIPVDKIRIQRQRRIFMEVAADKFRELLDYAQKELKFNHLGGITGLDEGESLGFIYHLCQDSGIILNVKTSVPKTDPQIKSVTEYYPCADVYERELVDLFGAKVSGLAPGHRYPLTDDWPKDEYPLRKDWRPKDA